MNNNFNYSNIPGELLYCNRRYLDEFDVEDLLSLNGLIQDWLIDEYSGFSDYEAFATLIFNCAYCICTRALVDSHPDRRVGAYVKEASECMHHNDNYTSTVLSIALLQINHHNWVRTPQMIRLAKELEIRLRSDEYYDVYSCFYQPVHKKAILIGSNSKNGIKVQSMDYFRPREINYQLLKETRLGMSWIEYFGKDSDKILEFVFALGKNEKEQKIISTFLRDELHSAFTNGREYKWCFEEIDRGIYQLHHGEEERKQIEDEINADLKAQMMEQFEKDDLQQQVEQLKTENAQLREQLQAQIIKIKEDKTDDEAKAVIEEVEDVKEQEDGLYNKVNFEFFLLLLEKAGFDINNTGNKTRVGKLWHMLTGKSGDELRRFCSDRKPINNHTRADAERLNLKLKEMGINIQIQPK